MRILIGTTEICGLIPVYKKGFESLGHDVTTVVSNPNRFYTDNRYDISLVQSKLASDFGYLASKFSIIFSEWIQDLFNLSKVKKLIDNHDIFIFLWGGTSLLNRHKDFPLIKQENKKIISIFVGSDIRYMPVFNEQYSVGGELMNVQTDDSLASKLENLRMGEFYGDAIYSVPDQSGLAVRPFQHFQIPLDLSQFKFTVPSRNIPRIVHIPSNPEAKGTRIISEILDKLKKNGIPFEWNCLTNITHGRVLDELTNADILVDEIVFHGPGVLSLEAMASGCAVATKHLGNSPDFFKPPLVNINPIDCFENLKELILNKDLRLKLAYGGREYVEANNDCTKVAKGIMLDLQSPSILSEYYPHFIFKNHSLLTGKKITKKILRLTGKIIEKYGIPLDIDPDKLKKEGFVPNTFKPKKIWPHTN